VITSSKITIFVAIILVAASTVLAKDGGLPKLDIEYACRASEKAVAAIVSVATDIFGSCKADEEAARDELRKDWTTFPASDKARCIQPKEYLPSYVEWLTCLGIARDVKAMRKEQPGPRSSIDKCPVVRYLDDGPIISVTAC
jgi:hypothetical protein